MFKELEKQVFPFKFGNAEIYLRYDNNALCALERMGVDYLSAKADTEDTAALLLAGLRDYFDTVGIETDKQTKIVADIISVAKPHELCSGIFAAVLFALPKPIIGQEKKDGTPDISFIKTLFCDIMGKPDAEFWSSTLREIMERWERYAVYMGYQKPPIEVSEFDDD